jgi:hypothetical protein
MSASEFREAYGEMWLADKVGADLQGTTTSGCRRARVRAAIEAGHLADTVVGKGPDGTPQTAAQAFDRLYGVPFHVTELEYAAQDETL